MADSALQLTLREMRRLFGSLQGWAVLVVVALVLGISGPFGTFEALGTAARLAYWFAVSFLTFAGGAFGSTYVSHLLKQRNAPLWLHMIADTLAATLPAVIIILAINLVAFGTTDLDGFSVVQMFIYVFVISAGVTALFLVFETTQRNQEPTTKTAPKLLDRLDVTKRGALISLSVEDHYVQVVTTRGKAMLLMRFSDAIGETAGAEGVQIHRSHWVAVDGVAAIRKQAGRTLVETKAGELLPVSRGYQAAARAAGLIA